MTVPNDLREAYTGQRRGPPAGFASGLSNSASKCLAADGDGLGRPEPNTDRAVVGEALEGLPGSKSVARVAAAARNQGDPAGSRRTNYEGQAGRGVRRQEEHPEARQGVGFVHSSLRQVVSLEAGEGANRLTKHAPATRCRKNDGISLANLPAGDTPRVSLRSPVREYCTPGSVRGAPGNRCPYLDTIMRARDWAIIRPTRRWACKRVARPRPWPGWFAWKGPIKTATNKPRSI